MSPFKIKAFVGSLLLASTVSFAGVEVVYVPSAPPRAVHEVIVKSPGAGYVWIPGYHKWDGGAYTWVGGRWDMKPAGHSKWVAGRWNHHNGKGWYWQEGRWR